MRTKINARKKTVLRWISEKFGSLEMLANVAGIDTSHPEVRNLLRQVETSRESVILSIAWRNNVIRIDIGHHLAETATKPDFGVGPEMARVNVEGEE